MLNYVIKLNKTKNDLVILFSISNIKHCVKFNEDKHI